MLLAPILTLFVVPVLGTYFLPDEQFLKRAKKRRPNDAPDGTDTVPEGAAAE